MNVLSIAGVIGAGAGAWMVTPLVSMARRGTLDQQAVAGWRTEAARVEAERAADAERAAAITRARRRSALVASIPGPRGSEHDQLRSPAAG